MSKQRLGSILLLTSAVTIGFSLSANAQKAEEVEKKAVSPKDGVIKLFNGKDLSGLYTWMPETKYKDPKNVFSVKDGMLHIKGNALGYICTKKPYKNYHMVLEFRWGDRTWGRRKDRTKDSGALVHCVGPDGSAGTWMASIEAQIIQGGVGDFIIVGGKYADGTPVPMSLTAKVTQDRDGEYVWKKGGKPKTFNGGRINWFGRDPDWKDVLGFRGKNDVESPGKEWTRMDVICDGGKITNIVNGVVVNKGYDAFPRAGKILLQTELAELYVRRWELWPLGEAPPYKPNQKK